MPKVYVYRLSNNLSLYGFSEDDVLVIVTSKVVRKRDLGKELVMTTQNGSKYTGRFSPRIVVPNARVVFHDGQLFIEYNENGGVVTKQINAAKKSNSVWRIDTHSSQ